jgi:hypothetical protein
MQLIKKLNMRRSFLETAYKEKSLIGFRTISLEWDESIIGFVIDLDESYVTVDEIDEYGFHIGNTIFTLEDIVDVEINDRYQKRLKFIYENNSIFNPINQCTIWKEGPGLVPHFNFLFENKKITTLYFDEANYVTGVLLKFNENYFTINNIGSEGDEDGISCHPIEKLIGLRYDGLEEQKIKLLYENRADFYKD